MTTPRHTHFVRASLIGEILLGLTVGVGLFMAFAPEILEWLK